MSRGAQPRKRSEPEAEQPRPSGMSGRPRIDVFRHADAPVEVVWSIVSDHRGYRTWTPVTTSELEVEGSPHPDGVGAVRKLGVRPIFAREQMIEFDPPHHFAYTILSGIPVRDYRADVDLFDTADGGCDIRWTGSFGSAPPAMRRLLRAFLERILEDSAARLVKEARRRSAAGTSTQ
jgi:uncharacterized protein YndB with AHSA1/START domain